MKAVLSSCACVVVLFAAGVMVAQQGGSQPQGDGRAVTDSEQLGTLKPVERELFELKKKDTEEKAKQKDTIEKAAAKDSEYRKELEKLTRQRQPDETPAAYAAWQKEQTQTVNRLDRENQKLRGQAGMAGLNRNEAGDELEKFRNRNPTVELPDWANRRIARIENAAPPAVPQRHSGPIDLRKGPAFEQLVGAFRRGPEGGTVIDGSQRDKGLPDSDHRPGPGGRGDPLPERAAPSVQRPAPPVKQEPIIEAGSREQKTITKPGGVIITATAEIAGLRPENVASASFDASTGTLTLALRSGKRVTCEMDSDDFAVAVRGVFDRQVDMSLTLSHAAEKPGYKAVNYTGPLHNTRFCKILLETDELLGDIIFNREGDHRQIAAAAIPHFADLVCEANRTMKLGSRVFLRATAAQFAVADGRLVCLRIQAKVDVEGMNYAADYYQESLHRLARSMDEQFETLADQFKEFSEFRRLTAYVAIAKWLKRHAISFDWTALRTRAIAKVDVPAFVPAVDWRSLFNGRNLDGWRFNLPAGQVDSAVEGGRLRLKPTGSNAIQFLSSVWSQAYDLRYVVSSEGPVEFLIRDDAGKEREAITIDTEGRPQEIELFMRNGKWRAVAPAVDKHGGAEKPKPKKDEQRKPSDHGIRVPPGSKLTLHAASLRQW